MRVRLGYDHIYSQIMIRRESYQTDSNADPSRYQHQGRSQKGEQELSRQESVKSSTRSDGSGHSVLETLGQTQRCGDDGDDVGCEEFSMSNKLPGREAEYLGEQTGGARIEYYVAKINITSKTRYKKYNMKLRQNILFIFSRMKRPVLSQITVIIQAEGTDSKQVSNKPTSWSKIFFFFFPSDGFLSRR